MWTVFVTDNYHCCITQYTTPSVRPNPKLCAACGNFTRKLMTHWKVNGCERYRNVKTLWGNSWATFSHDAALLWPVEIPLMIIKGNSVSCPKTSSLFIFDFTLPLTHRKTQFHSFTLCSTLMSPAPSNMRQWVWTEIQRNSRAVSWKAHFLSKLSLSD